MAFIGSLDRAERGHGNGRAPLNPTPGAGTDRGSDRADDEIQDFVQQWGMDPNIADIISGELSPEHARKIMSEFNPPEGTANVSGKFMSFFGKFKERISNIDRGAPASSAGRGSDILTFARQWGIDSEAIRILERQPPHMQREIMRDFNPTPGCTNVSAAFSSFARRRGGSGAALSSSRDEIQDFATRWGLDATAVELVRGQSPEMQAKILKGVNPPPGTRNPNARLSSWIANIMAGGGPTHETQESASWRSSHHGGGRDEVHDFVKRWGLDEAAGELVRAQSSDMQAKIIAEFHPPPGTRNPNARLSSWIANIQRDSGVKRDHEGGHAPPLKQPRRTSW
jgi:hypothetical protein